MLPVTFPLPLDGPVALSPTSPITVPDHTPPPSQGSDSEDSSPPIPATSTTPAVSASPKQPSTQMNDDDILDLIHHLRQNVETRESYAKVNINLRRIAPRKVVNRAVRRDAKYRLRERLAAEK